MVGSGSTDFRCAPHEPAQCGLCSHSLLRLRSRSIRWHVGKHVAVARCVSPERSLTDANFSRSETKLSPLLSPTILTRDIEGRIVAQDDIYTWLQRSSSETMPLLRQSLGLSANAALQFGSRAAKHAAYTFPRCYWIALRLR